MFSQSFFLTVFSRITHYLISWICVTYKPVLPDPSLLYGLAQKTPGSSLRFFFILVGSFFISVLLSLCFFLKFLGGSPLETWFITVFLSHAVRGSPFKSCFSSVFLLQAPRDFFLCHCSSQLSLGTFISVKLLWDNDWLNKSELKSHYLKTLRVFAIFIYNITPWNAWLRHLDRFKLSMCGGSKAEIKMVQD